MTIGITLFWDILFHARARAHLYLSHRILRKNLQTYLTKQHSNM